MYLMFFLANNAWAFVFGQDRRTAKPIALSNEPMFFEKRQEAFDAASRHGLTINRRPFGSWHDIVLEVH